MIRTDFPTHLLDLTLNGKVLGTVLLLSNAGKIRVSNNAQYDEGSSPVVVRGTENNVSVWYDVDARTLDSERGSYTRRDKFLTDSTPAAKTTMRDAILVTLANFLLTDEGAGFVKDGRIVAARNAVARCEAKLAEAREAEQAALLDLVEKSCDLVKLTGKV